MNRLLLATFVMAAFGSGTALAADRCDVPKSDWQPREALQKKLEDSGWKVNRVKTEDGCYEVYAHDDKGQKVEAYFDPKTFETVKIKNED